MQLFISYRRVDNDYLAADLAGRLQAQGFQVFLDVASIRPGDQFPAITLERVRSSEALLALIGPAWQPGRLRDEEDFVRAELLAAQAHEVRVIPVLHGGAEPPATLELPPDLAWLSHRHMVRFGSAAHLTQDVDRLVAQLNEQVPVLSELRALAWRQYEQSDHDGLVATVEAAWREHADRPSPALADCCRTAALSYTRTGQMSGARDLWLARALSTAFLARAPHAFAASLLPFFFRLLDEGTTDEARAVLQEIGRLVQVDEPSQLPPVRMMRRLVREKTGYLLYLDGKAAEALSEYGAALEHTSPTDDLRGALKIRGAMALCMALLDRPGEAREQLGVVLAEAEQGGFTDVARTARGNLEALDAGTATLSFEVT